MSEFLLKPRIRFGQDALAILNELPARNVLLVTDQAMVKFGLADRVTQILNARGIAFQVWDDVVADPDIATVVRGMKRMDNSYPDLVIALGGGSVIDAAKAVIFALAQTRPNAHREPPCFVAIPTTSGTGSEVTAFSVVKAHAEKLVLVDPSLLPDIAILDPALVASVPPATFPMRWRRKWCSRYFVFCRPAGATVATCWRGKRCTTPPAWRAWLSPTPRWASPTALPTRSAACFASPTAALTPC